MFSANKEKDENDLGMTLPELILAVILFTAFATTYVIVANFTAAFFRPPDDLASDSQGLLIDRHKIYVAMDSYSEILSQPGYSWAEIQQLSKTCPYDPHVTWKLPGKKQDLPAGYRVCLLTTSIPEDDINELINSNSAKPGIYILHAIPDRVSNLALPVRRLFCRPKPYC